MLEIIPKADTNLSKEIIEKIKMLRGKEREYFVFKMFFNEFNGNEEKVLEEIIKLNPFSFNRLCKIIDEANDARRRSKNAIYNREKCCIEIMNAYKLLLEKMCKLAKELYISNSLELSILFSYLLWKGYLSKTKVQEYEEYDGPLLLGLNFTDISNGIGVCRNFSEMLKDFLSYCGYHSVILENYFGNIKSDYIMDIFERKNCIISNYNNTRKKEPNHVFNLIEDNGLYIYDPTNLLLFNFKDKNTATLINGNGKNIIYPYKSYDFCYSKEDEQLLDIMFAEDKFISQYDKTDFISTSEVTLEIIQNNTSLLEDFYVESKPDILRISEETKKVLTRKK